VGKAWQGEAWRGPNPWRGLRLALLRGKRACRLSRILSLWQYGHWHRRPIVPGAATPIGTSIACSTSLRLAGEEYRQRGPKRGAGSPNDTSSPVFGGLEDPISDTLLDPLSDRELSEYPSDFAFEF
jgi:hypothetical protein